MSQTPVLVVLLPLAAAGVSALVRTRRTVQRVVSLAAVTIVVGLGAALLAATSDGSVVVAVPGGHPAALGIALTVDPLSALMVTATATLALAVLVTMVLRDDDRRPFLHPLVLVLLGGVWGTLVTGDLFNLFVFFEMTLIASYVLLLIDGDEGQVRAGAVYVTVNLLGSLVFLAGAGLLYGAAGTVNLATLALGAEVGAPVRVGQWLVIVAFAVKAGLVPFGGWLRLAYPAASRTIMALFAGLLTTVGVVALYRVVLLGFADAEGVGAVVLAAALATAVGGAAASLSLPDPWRVLALVVMSQAGFMVVGLGLGGRRAIEAGVFFVAQDVLVKTALFLAVCAAETVDTGDRELPHARPWIVATIAVTSLSLAGVPPMSGFVGKALLVHAALDAGRFVVAALVLLASLAVLTAVGRAFRSTAWRTVTVERPPAPGPRLRARVVAAPAAVLAIAAVALGVAPNLLGGAAARAADVLLDPGAYARAVLG